MTGDSAIDAEKGKSIGTLLNRGKKRQLKSNAVVAWGRLVSQCSQVSFDSSIILVFFSGVWFLVCHAELNSATSWQEFTC